MKLLPYGRQAVLVEVADAASVHGVAAALRGVEGVLEVVPAARTVLVRWAEGRQEPVTTALAGLSAVSVDDPSSPAALVELDVVYDGEDLASTAAEVGLDADGLVRAHSGADYVVGFCGFAPGFAYLTGLDPALHVPRLAQPRTRVPTGSVAVAGEFTGVYPRPSPGGWRLLGRTDATLWDVDRDPPALLVPGTRVRFRPLR